ncbi:MAG: FtsW/RodA/SpoVE family cell cycle protein [Thermomicrobiales bacterium]
MPVVAMIGAQVVAVVLLTRFLPDFDRVLLSAIAALAAIGLTTLLSLAATADDSGPFFAEVANRQAIFVTCGFLVLVVGALLARHLEVLRAYPYSLLTLALLLTAATMVAGETVNGARLWLAVGPVRFQPAEIGRVLLALFVAVFLYERRNLLRVPWRVGPVDLPPAPYLLPLGVALLAAVAVLVLQNDLGMAALLALGAATAVFAVGGHPTLMLLVSAGFAAAAVGAFHTVSRVQDRLVGWLDPWRDPSAVGFQFVQSEFALSAGGIVGEANARNLSNVPEVHTDFALTAIGTVLGVAGAMAVLALAALIVCRCVIAALRVSGGLQSFVVLSITALFAMQAILIAGGTLRVLPLTGLTFPFVSYGGTSLLTSFLSMGIVIGVGARSRC